MFNELCASLKQAKKILQGKMKPSRMHIWEKDIIEPKTIVFSDKSEEEIKKIEKKNTLDYFKNIMNSNITKSSYKDLKKCYCCGKFTKELKIIHYDVTGICKDDVRVCINCKKKKKKQINDKFYSRC